MHSIYWLFACIFCVVAGYVIGHVLETHPIKTELGNVYDLVGDLLVPFRNEGSFEAKVQAALNEQRLFHDLLESDQDGVIRLAGTNVAGMSDSYAWPRTPISPRVTRRLALVHNQFDREVEQAMALGNAGAAPIPYWSD